MEKMLKSLAVICVMAILTACSNTADNSNTNLNSSEINSESSSAYSSYAENSSSYSYEYSSSYSYEYSSEDDYYYDDSWDDDYYNDDTYYISNRNVQYDEAIGKNQVLWSISKGTTEGDYIAIETTVHIRVVNNSGDTVLDKDYAVTSDEYHTGTNTFDHTPILYGWLNIDEEDYIKGNTDEGTLYLSATLDNGASFSEAAYSITHLPLKSLNIKLPDLPLTINNYYYEETPQRIIQIINADIEYVSNDDASITAELIVKATMTYNAEGEGHSDSTSIGYKLKDSEGTVVDSGEMFIDPMCVGETVKDSMSFYELDLNESYTLEFIDTD